MLLPTHASGQLAWKVALTAEQSKPQQEAGIIRCPGLSKFIGRGGRGLLSKKMSDATEAVVTAAVRAGLDSCGLNLGVTSGARYVLQCLAVLGVAFGAAIVGAWALCAFFAASEERARERGAVAEPARVRRFGASITALMVPPTSNVGRRPRPMIPLNLGEPAAPAGVRTWHAAPERARAAVTAWTFEAPAPAG